MLGDCEVMMLFPAQLVIGQLDVVKKGKLVIGHLKVVGQKKKKEGRDRKNTVPSTVVVTVGFEPTTLRT